MTDVETWYPVIKARDARFDGRIWVGVTSTRIYCRPSCSAITPKRENTRFFRSAAAAQHAGFRACKRCRPDAVPGSPEWNVRADVVGRAMRLIADGVVDRDGVDGLAARLGYSTRQVHRLLVGDVGAAPLQIARAQRAHTARVLIETTTMAFTDVAFAAGFESIRQFNDTIRDVFAMTPTALRSLRRPDQTTELITVRLPVRAPFDAAGLLAFFGARAVPGVEEIVGGTYRRSLRLPHGNGVIALTPHHDHVSCSVDLDDLRDTGTAVSRARRMFDLDTDPIEVNDVLALDDVLAPLVHRRPGLRVPGHVDPHEVAVRAVLGQQVSVAGARTAAARLVSALGEPLARPSGSIDRVFPSMDALATADDALLAMPAARRRALRSLCGALAEGNITLDTAAERSNLHDELVALDGIGPWTASYIALRGLGDPDVFLPTDLGVRKALDHLGVASDPRLAAARAERWRPWRSYALLHLWASLDDRPPNPRKQP